MEKEVVFETPNRFLHSVLQQILYIKKQGFYSSAYLLTTQSIRKHFEER